MKTKNLKQAIRLQLAVAAGLSSLVAPNLYAFDQEEGVERIEVTGSRLKRTDMETPVPVTVIGRTEILSTGALNVADVLNQSPIAIAGTSNANSAFTTSAVGLNTTALRNLGDERTLVLVNGRRFVSGKAPSDGYAVDLNSIPTSMIERIEILKSASSAVYGSDAVAGVVNIILRKDFEGIELNASTGISDESDREQYSVSITGGNAWDTGNVTIAFGYDDDKGLKSKDRDFSAFDEAVLLDQDLNEYRGRVFSSFPPQGRVGGYNADGTPFTDDDRFNRADFRQLITPLERKYAAFNFQQELSDDILLFSEFNWNTAKTYDSTIEPTPLDVVNDIWLKDRGGEGGIWLSPDVAGAPAGYEGYLLIPELLRTNLLNDGLTNINETTFVRRLVEFGARSTDLERDTSRIATGIDWNIDDNWLINTYVAWGKTDQIQENGGQMNIERAVQALDVEVDPDTGELRCVDAHARLQGCVPLNMFGAGTVTDDAVAYVRSPAKVTGQAEQFIFAINLIGELPLELPGGSPGVAFGYERRVEKGVFSPGDLAQTGSSSTNKSTPTDGSFGTNDIYGEIALPILDNLELDLAARYSDHDIVDGNTTWNVGFQYSPTSEFMVRASIASAVRTPNIADLFGGRGETFANVTDPCSGLSLTSTGNVAENCRSIPEVLERMENHPDGIFELTQIEAQGTGGTIGGNVNVKEEEADTLSVGIVWQIIDEVSLTLDYYDIEVTDAISTTSRTTVLNRCFDVAPGEFDPGCGTYESETGPQPNATRDFKGALTEVHSGTSNENDIQTSGLDVELTYTDDIGPGTFRAFLLWNYIDEWVQTSIEDGSSVDYAGEVLTPENRANLNLSYAWDDFVFTWRSRYWDSSVDSVEGANFNFSNFEPLNEFNNFGSYTIHDLTATYHVTENAQAGFVIKNAFDKEPPFAGQGFNNGATGVNTVAEAYDVTGRYYQFNVTMKF